jgi:hypothetical protein
MICTTLQVRLPILGLGHLQARSTLPVPKPPTWQIGNAGAFGCERVNHLRHVLGGVALP